jgi:trimeric autotransporter adhesin
MNTNVRMAVVAVLVATVTVTLPGIASQVGSLVSFTANTPAKASEVNGNFTVVKTAVDDNQAQITALNARIAALEAKLTNVVALNDYLSLQTVNGYPTVRVSAANLQVVNGQGGTDKINGLGNLVVGYDELRPDTDSKTCSISISNNITNQDACTSPAVWAVNHKNGSHNLIVGRTNNYSSYGGVVFGEGNAIIGAGSNVTGGRSNVASGQLTSVTGGANNGAWGLRSSVSGGVGNTSSGQDSAVSGGLNNTASGFFSTVSAGGNNLASGQQSVVGGGTGNSATAIWSTVSGGYHNIASGVESTVSGGSTNKATAEASTVSGGYNNTAAGGGSTASGGANHNSGSQNSWYGGTGFSSAD